MLTSPAFTITKDPVSGPLSLFAEVISLRSDLADWAGDLWTGRACKTDQFVTPWGVDCLPALALHLFRPTCCVLPVWQEAILIASVERIY